MEYRRRAKTRFKSVEDLLVEAVHVLIKSELRHCPNLLHSAMNGVHTSSGLIVVTNYVVSRLYRTCIDLASITIGLLIVCGILIQCCVFSCT